MKKLFCLFIMLILSVFVYTNISIASVALPWSTTYDCDDWEQTLSLNCDGLSNYGSWTSDNGDSTYEVEQITADANNPGGEGGKGQRHWEGDGTNNLSGGTKIEFTSSQPELWVRWYMRYEQGFKWNSQEYDKILYFDVGTTHAVIAGWRDGDKVMLRSLYDSNVVQKSTDGNGWNTIMGGSASDGQWHYYEVYLKMDTDGSDGIAEMWIDGVKRLTYTNVNYGTHSGWTSFVIGSNQATPNNDRSMAVDFDDIAISNTGYIGPLPDTIPPSPPVNAN